FLRDEFHALPGCQCRWFAKRTRNGLLRTVAAWGAQAWRLVPDAVVPCADRSAGDRPCKRLSGAERIAPSRQAGRQESGGLPVACRADATGGVGRQGNS